MAKVIVNRQKKTRTLACGTVLEMGANVVEDGVYEAARLIPYQDELFKRGFLAVKEMPKAVEEYRAGNFIEDFGKLKIVAALKAVEDCQDPHTLNQWLQQDGRKRVRDAITAKGVKLTQENPEGTVAPPSDGDDLDIQESEQD